MKLLTILIFMAVLSFANTTSWQEALQKQDFKSFKSLAEKDLSNNPSVDLLSNLSVYYLMKEKDTKKSIDLLSKYVDKYPVLWQLLGVSYQVGNDFDNAYKYYTIAHDKKVYDANPNLAVLYFMGKGVPKNIKKGVELLEECVEKASTENKIKCASMLGSEYLGGELLTKDKDKSFYWYKKASDLGSDTASLQIAMFYSIEKKPAEAFPYLVKSSNLGNLEAKYYLAQDYLFRLKENEKAKDLFLEAVNQNYPNVRYYLAATYEQLHDYKNAEHWFKEEMKVNPKNSANVYFALGDLYLYNIGEKVNVSKTLGYYEKAAKLDNKYSSKLSLAKESLANKISNALVLSMVNNTVKDEIINNIKITNIEYNAKFNTNSVYFTYPDKKYIQMYGKLGLYKDSRGVWKGTNISLRSNPNEL